MVGKNMKKMIVAGVIVTAIVISGSWQIPACL